MPKYFSLGYRARNVCSHDDCKDCKKRIFAKACCSVLIVFLIFLFPSPAFAQSTGPNNRYCVNLLITRNRVVSSVGQVFYTYTTVNGSYPSDNWVRNFCYDSPGSSQYSGVEIAGANSTPVATRLVIVPGNDFSPHYGAIESWPLTEVASQMGCHSSLAVSSPSSGGDLLSSIIGALPQSPEGARIPTIISNLASEGSLAAQLSIELYSTVWQYLALLLGFKFLKIIRG